MHFAFDFHVLIFSFLFYELILLALIDIDIPCVPAHDVQIVQGL